MKRKQLSELANKAGYVLGMMVVPNKCYTLTDITTRKKYRMPIKARDIIAILNREIERNNK